MIDRQHPPDLYDLFRFGKADLTHNSELMRKLAVLFCSTMDHDLRSYSMERFVNIDDEAIEAIKHLLYPLLKLDLADGGNAINPRDFVVRGSCSTPTAPTKRSRRAPAFRHRDIRLIVIY